MNSTAFFDPSYIVSGLVYIFPYLKVTLGLTVSSVRLGTFWALFCAFLEIRRVPLFKELAALYVLICRSLPNMVLLYLVYYGLPILLWPWTKKAYFIFPWKSNSPPSSCRGAHPPYRGVFNGDFSSCL